MQSGFWGSSASGGLNTHKCCKHVDRLFNSSTGSYCSKLKDKLKLIMKFIHEFEINLSTALNYGQGGCSIFSIEGNY